MIRRFDLRLAMSRVQYFLRPYSVITKTEWTWFVLPVIISLSTMISVGPFLQQYIFSIGNISAPTIYEAAFGAGMVNYPSAAEWFGMSLNPLFLSVSAMCVLIGARRPTYRSFAKDCAITFAISMTTIDIIVQIISKNPSASFTIQNIVANCSGAALIFGIMMAICHFRAYLNTSRDIRIFAPALFICAISLSFCAFLISSWVYAPTNVQFNSIAYPPISGSFSPKTEEFPENLRTVGEELRSAEFEFLRDQSATDIEINAIKSAPLIKFKSKKQSIKYKFSIILVVNCSTNGAARLFSIGSHYINQGFANSVSIKVKRRDLTNISIVNDNTISFKQNSPSFFWLKGKDKEKFEVSRFTSAGDKLEASVFDTIAAKIEVFPFTENKGRRVEDPAEISLNQDGSKAVVRINPGVITDDKSTRSCERVSPAKTEGGIIEYQLPDNSVYATLALRFDEPKFENDDIFLDRATLTVSESAGWLGATLNGKSIEKRLNLGETDFIAYSGEKSALQVDGHAVDVQPTDQITLMGHISGYLAKDGGLALSGDSNMMWVGKRRVNPTRWERMSSEMQVLILSFVGIVLLALARTLMANFGWLFGDGRFRRIAR